MNQDKIQSLELQNFRGATKPVKIDLDPKKSMVMIFGENGTGKSTLVDALDFIFNKNAGSLAEKSSTNIKKHLPAIRAKAQDVKVLIKSQKQKEWQGTLDGSSPLIKGDTGRFSVGILRRDKILKLVNARPKDRYDALKNFIELPNIRSAEESLRKVLKELENNLSQNIHTNTEQKQTLQQSWEEENSPGDSFLEWAKEISQKQNDELEKKSQQYENTGKIIRKAIDCWEHFKKSKHDLNESDMNLQSIKDKIQEAGKKTQPIEIIDILQKTKSFLEQSQTEDCPVCEQPIDRANLKIRIVERLKSETILMELNKEIKKTTEQHNTNSTIFLTNHKELIDAIKNLNKYIEKEEHIDEIIKIKQQFNIKSLLNQNSFKSDSQSSRSFITDEKLNQNSIIENDINIEKAEDFFKSLNPILEKLRKLYQANQKQLDQLNLIKTAYLSLKNTEKKIEKLNKKTEFLQKILNIMEPERKTYIDNLLSNISQDIGSLYVKLHPKEGVQDISLYLKSKGTGSLEIKSSFQEVKAPPQAYFSDSHLDTLGICIFIAMAKYFKNDIIVLDDVVTSVDQQHLSRFIKMLHDENKHFSQIILTTHYRPWREKYKFYRQPNSNIQLIELSALWSIERGIRSSQTKLSIEELEILKNQTPFDRQNAGSKAGIFLESVLDYLSLLYECRLPRRPEPQYTLGELMNCFSKKFTDKLKVKKGNDDFVPLSSVINELFQTAETIRNQVGAHWNIAGMDISDQEVMTFLDKTLELGKTLICNECGELPQQKKQDCWQCGCGQTELYPISKR